MLRMYRPETNVVRRPGKTGHAVLGHHEVLIPILHAMILRESGARRGKRAR